MKHATTITAAGAQPKWQACWCRLRRLNNDIALLIHCIYLPPFFWHVLACGFPSAGFPAATPAGRRSVTLRSRIRHLFRVSGKCTANTPSNENNQIQGTPSRKAVGTQASILKSIGHCLPPPHYQTRQKWPHGTKCW